MSVWPIATRDHSCSFCGRAEHEADVLLAGASNVFICDACVDNCAELVAAKRRKRRATRPKSPNDRA